MARGRSNDDMTPNVEMPDMPPSLPDPTDGPYPSGMNVPGRTMGYGTAWKPDRSTVSGNYGQAVSTAARARNAARKALRLGSQQQQG